MAMHTPTRRGLIGAIAAVPAAIVMNSVPATAGMTIDRSNWDCAFAKMEKAVAEERVYGKVHDAAYEAYEAERPARPHWYGKVMLGSLGRLKIYDVDGSLTKELAGEGKWWGGDGVKQQLREGANELRRYKAADQAAADRHNFTAIEARYEQIADVAYEAKWTLFGLPAPDHAALAWKAEHLFGVCAGGNEDSAPAWSGKVIEVYMADVRRLCGEA